MTESKPYIQTLFTAKGISIPLNKQSLFENFVSENENKKAVETIIQNQNLLMESWKIRSRISDILAQQIIIPNATIGKLYQAKLDFEKLQLTDIIAEAYEGLADLGLNFNSVTDTIEGIPNQSGDLKFRFLFKIEGEPETGPFHEKQISIVVNPDPRTLWKDLPSDKTNIFWKEDDISSFGKLGTKNIVVSSKRGRSHKNVGSFRDDDFAFKYFDNTGWSVVAVSDGAGSYSLSRKGSEIACNSVLDFFGKYHDFERQNELEENLAKYFKNKEDVLWQEILVMAKQNLYKATVHVHNKIKEFAEEAFKTYPDLFNSSKAKTNLDYFHSTLIFALFKKFDFGYVILTFGVGDCPIAVMDKTGNETTLLNWLDVGEFGGGTRFITQPEIFHSKENPMVSRFNLKIVEDFSYLFLMSDGIYDPKFIVEANLEKSEKWVDFLDDLKGKNEENVKVDFDSGNPDIGNQLSRWMDFWSPGNHDDRTLAIIY